MKILKIIIKYISLIKQGATLKDKLIIFFYFIKTPIYMIKQKFNINYNHKLIGEVTVKSEDGIFFCGDNIFPVWVGSNFHEQKLRKYFNISEGTFIDIGANIGKFSIIMGKKLDDKGKVLAIEPHPKNFKILQKNIELNNLKNVTTLNLACSNKKGNLQLFLDEDGTGGHSTIKSKKTKAGNNKIWVKAETLDSIIKKEKIKKVNLIKIDVEGAEANVLRGAIKTLNKSRPKIIFEAWDEQYLKKVKKILNKFNYKIKKLPEENYLAYFLPLNTNPPK